MDPDATVKKKGMYIFATLVAVALAVVTEVTGGKCPDIEDNFTHMILHKDTVYIAGSKCVCRGKAGVLEPCAETGSRTTVLVLVAETQLLMCYASGKCETRMLNKNDLSSNTSLELSPSIFGDENETIVFPSSLSGNSTVLYTSTKVSLGNSNNATSTLSVWKLEYQLKKATRTYTIDLVENVTQMYRTNYNPVGGFSFNGAGHFFANQIANTTNNSTVSKLIVVCNNTYTDVVIDRNYWEPISDVVLLSAGQNHEKFKSAHNTTYDALVLAVFENRENNTSRLTYYTFEDLYTSLSYAATSMQEDRYLKPYRLNNTCNRSKETLCQSEERCKNFIAEFSSQVGSLGNLTNLLSGLREPIGRIHRVTGASIHGGLHSLILVAPTNGSVQMLYITRNKNLLKGVYIGNLSIEGTAVRQMKIVEDDGVIVLYENRTEKECLHKVPCNGIISSCLNRSDPFCGWCWNKTKCTTFKDCGHLYWIPINADDGDAFIDTLSPDKGPMAGGTRLTLNGRSLHLLSISISALTITIGEKTCTGINITSHDVMTCLTPPSQSPGQQNVTWTNGKSDINPIGTFRYVEDPTIAGIFPNRSFDSGGRNLVISGTNFDAIQNPRMQIVGASVSEGCRHTNDSLIECSAPTITKDLRDKLEIDNNPDNADLIQVEVEFKMDGVNSSLLRQTLEIVSDPVFYNFTEEGMTKELVEGIRTVIIIRGERINIAAAAADFHVTVGRNSCDVLSRKVYRTEIHCLAPESRPLTISDDSEEPEVQIRLGYIQRRVGYLRYIPSSKVHLYLYITVGFLALGVLALVIIGVLLRRRSRLAVEKLQDDMEQMELRMQTEFRQAFAELQTDMTDITGELVETGLPYNKFNVYAFQILFPTDDVTEMTSHKLARYPEIDCVDVTSLDTAMLELESLFLNKFFVITVINTLENQRTLSLSDKSTFAGCLAACLLQNMDFFSQLTKLLLEQYVPDAIARKKHKSLFRRCESITETVTSTWLGMCLHQHLLKSRGGSALIMLVKAMQTVMEKAPIDAVTGAARATLAYDQLLLTQTDNDQSITLKVQINGGEFATTCAVLQCDTITQVKAKCLGVIYKKDPASIRPRSADIDLQWLSGNQGKLILKEEDTCPAADENHVKLMTLSDYHVTDGSLVELLNKHTTEEEEDRYVNYKNIQQQQLTHSEVQLLVEDEEEEEEKGGSSRVDAIRYHLVKPDEEDQGKTRILPEAHLHKLLQAKINVKKFVDDVIDSALDKKDVPLCVKYLFCVLEGLALRHDVDQDTLVSWKNNSYPVRFWGRLLSRPNIVFDIDTPEYLQPSLDIVASTFIDSFTPPQMLSKNSSPHKLLFFKDLDDYRAVVKSFHRGVSSAPAVDERDMAKEMHKLTYMQSFNLNKIAVFYELFLVIAKFKDEVLSDLEENKDTSRLKLSEKLEHVLELMES
ncbi:plexin-A1-like [Haliotis rufescens]|uniref:plexin-A1-like n=1 Tax=Haliotis rufescens TaxID=6454 RepID=UPI00201F6056|nr:plexin-A1-like [Haliotis rufescens]XP_046336293.2 plexin-A1-like [Haliotis rufescens]XP_046336294.2 plexin-A1-like [Haliotis rufescens]